MTEEIKDNEEVLEEAETIDESGASDAATDSQEELTVEQQLKAALEEASEYKDRWMRGQAEFANARKRMDKQRIQSYQNALAELAGKILPAIDDLDRAVENVPTAIAEDGWFEGIELVQKKMITILENFNVKPIEAVGEPFDPNIHEAITMEPSDEYDSEVVIREMQKGYMIGDQVIRPSLVVISQ